MFEVRHETRFIPRMTIPGVRALFRKHPRAVRRFAGGAAAAAALGLVVLGADPLLSGPLRSWAERSMNARMNGYRIHIGRARLHLWRMGFEVDDLVLVQTAHPDPPVADLGALAFSLQWWELLRWKVAGDLTIHHPALHINLAQIQDEAASQVSLEDRGWQRAVEAIFPIKLNQVNIQDGSLLYLAQGTEAKPLQFTHIALVARNVRNIDAAPGAFPSPVALEGLLFDSGTVSFQGTADFLRKPYAAARGELYLAHVPLDRFHPLASVYHLRTTGGSLTAEGTLEATPEARSAHLREILVEDLRVDYLTSPATQAMEKRHAEAAIKLARKVRNAPDLSLQVDHVKLARSEVGFINEGTSPAYRLFISGLDLDLTSLGNHTGSGRSGFHARGAFMGHGTAQAWGDSRTAADPADFKVHLEVENARLPDLNPLFNAYAGMDLAEGQISVFSELTVKDGRLDGYIKPILNHVKIYDRRKDAGKPLGARIRLHVLQALASLFRNHRSQEVATVVHLSGTTSSPKASEWETVRRLLGNGLFRAILPGFLAPAPPSRPEPGKAKRP